MNERPEHPRGFNGTIEQLLNALNYHPKRESMTTFHIKREAAWQIEQMQLEIQRLQGILAERDGRP